jgi:TonB family protein
VIARLAVCVCVFVACLRPGPVPPVPATPSAPPRPAGISKDGRSAAYFNLIRQQVEDHWHPTEVYRRYDSTGSIQGRADRPTIVRVRLTPEGTLLSVDIDQASGLVFLDELAIAAFWAAQPFPGPPPGLVNASSGLIDFKFGFRFDPGDRSHAGTPVSGPSAGSVGTGGDRGGSAFPQESGALPPNTGPKLPAPSTISR